MKKTLLSLGIMGILFLGTSNVFAAPMPPQAKNPPRVVKHQPSPPKRIVQPPRHIVHHQPPRHVLHKRHIAPPPPKYIVHNPQPYYATPVYDPGFALKVGNFFLSI